MWMYPNKIRNTVTKAASPLLPLLHRDAINGLVSVVPETPGTGTASQPAGAWEWG